MPVGQLCVKISMIHTLCSGSCDFNVANCKMAVEDRL